MTTSPYDSLPVGNNDTKPEETMEYVEVDLEQIKAIVDEIDDDPAVGKLSEPSPGDSELTAEVSQSTAEVSKPLVEVAAPPLPMSIPAARPKPPTKTTPPEKPPQYSRLNIKNLQGVYEYTLPFEESLLVPDTLPDMQRVLFAEGRADLSQPSKVSYDKDDFLTGDITVYTVYAPVPSRPSSPAAGPAAYTDSPVDVVKSIIPFKTDKCWDKADGDDFRVSLTVKKITAEMINERKFTVKGELCIKLTAIANKELKVFKSSEDHQLVTARDSIQATDLVHEATDTTEISQEITLKDDQPAPIKMLKETIHISEIHRQVTSGKLVINAVIHSQVLYIGELESGERKLTCLSNKTDFTQFIVMDNSSAPEMMKIHFDSSDLKMTIESKDKFLLQGNVVTHVQVFENKDVVTAADAYHKERDICFDLTTVDLAEVSGTVSGEISSREVVNLGEGDKKPEELICSSYRIASIQGRPEKGRIIIEGSMPVKILALDDEERPFIIEHTVPIRGSLEMTMPGLDTDGRHKTAPAGQPAAAPCELLDICVDAAVKDLWYDMINSRQIEINTSLTITVWASGQQTFCTLENLCFAETGIEPRRVPMAIYVVGRGDTLWDIAKRYKSDVAWLAELNEIDPQKPLPEGAKLFIAK